MTKALDLVGRTFGRLTVERFVESRLDLGGNRRRIYWVRCVCGTEKGVPSGSLLSGVVVSCGCFLREKVRLMRTKHGHAGNKAHTRKDTSEYRSWRAMRDRCTNPKMINWPNYGGRGIKVCDAWLASFATFLRDMGPKPTPQHTIERNDVNGNYEPGNCRWATRLEQARNKRT